MKDAPGSGQKLLNAVQYKASAVKCPSCGNSDINMFDASTSFKLHDIKPADDSSDFQTFHLLICRNCGFTSLYADKVTNG